MTCSQPTEESFAYPLHLGVIALRNVPVVHGSVVVQGADGQVMEVPLLGIGIPEPHICPKGDACPNRASCMALRAGMMDDAMLDGPVMTGYGLQLPDNGSIN